MSLPFYVADTLGMTVSQSGDVLTAKDARMLSLGPWKMDIQVKAHSDIVNPKEVGMWVQFSPTLWCYLIVRSKDCWLLPFNAIKAGVNDHTRRKIGGTTCKETVGNIKDHVTAVFRWTERDGWKKTPIDLTQV